MFFWENQIIRKDTLNRAKEVDIMTITVKEDKFYDAMVEIERAKVISNTLLNTYFDQNISGQQDFWKIAGYFYDNAKVLLEATISMVVTAENLLNGATGGMN